MRSTFRNWGRERTDFRPELLELSLAHTVGNAVERAYARDDGLEKRRTIMIAWAEFVSKPDKAARSRAALPVGESIAGLDREAHSPVDIGRTRSVLAK